MTASAEVLIFPPTPTAQGNALRPLGGGMTDPSIAELVRRLEDTSRAIERVATTLESSYVRREVYEAKHEALRAQQQQSIKEVADDVRDLQEARKTDAAFRRQIMAGAAVGLILLLINLVLATSNVMARGGLG